MRPLLYTAGLLYLLAARPAYAQTDSLQTPSLASAQTAPGVVGSHVNRDNDVAAVLQPDTVAAIHRLFVSKRNRCAYIVGGTTAATVTGMVAVSSQPERGSAAGGFSAGVDGRPIIASLIGIVGLPVIGLELLLLRDGWGRKAEQHAVEASQGHHQLPRYVRRELKPKYFQR